MKLIDPPGHNASVAKAADVLFAFTDETPELGVMELSRRVGLNKSTASRFVATLLGLGLIERVDHGNKYRLGTRLLELGMISMRHRPIFNEAQDLLDSLARPSRATASLSVAIGSRMLFIQKFDFGKPMPLSVGRGYPPHCSAPGKVLLSGLDAVTLEEFLRTPLAKRTEHTIRSEKRLLEEIALVREVGYASDREELEPGLASVAAPVYDRNAALVAAVALSLPCDRLSPASLPGLAHGVTEAAASLSQRLGYRAAITIRYPTDRRGGPGASASA